MRMTFRRSAGEIIGATLAAIIAPPARTPPSQWAAENLIVPDGPNAFGKWDLALTPYIREPLDMLASSSPVNVIAIRKSAQTGFTTMILGAVGHMIDQDPCRAMVVFPTSGSLSDFNRDKLTPAIERTDRLRQTVRPQTSRSGDSSTATSKVYPGGSLTLAIASSPADLRSKTIKVAYCDEVDQYPDDLDGQGSPLAMIEARQESFLASGEWKRLLISTPTIKGESKIDRAFEASDKRYWHVTAPCCGQPFHFRFDRKLFHFEENWPFKAYYTTPCCGEVIEAHQRDALVRKGQWIATDPKPGAYPGYHFDALSSPFVPWSTIAERWVKAQGDPKELKGFENLTLGLAFDPRGDAPDHVRLMQRRMADWKRGHIPPLGLILVGAADVQMNGIWYVIKAYGPDRQSWRVDAGYLAGATDDPWRGAFAELEKLREKKWPDAFGSSRKVDAFAVDSGYRSHVVYTWVRGKPDAFAIKGLDGWSKPAIGQPSPVDIDFAGKRIRNGAMVWGIGTWPLKGAFYADLRKEASAEGDNLAYPAGYCHFGTWMDEVYFRQITSEYLGNENYRGRVRRVWMVRSGEENHLLDCEIYSAGIADWLGLSRMTDDDWRTLAARRGVAVETMHEDLFDHRPVHAAAKPVAAPAMAKPNSFWDD